MAPFYCASPHIAMHQGTDPTKPTHLGAPSSSSGALCIGAHQLSNPVLLAPMAGVTDLPTRELCLRLGVGLAVAEMVTADPSLQDSRKTSLRRQHSTTGLRSIQIVGHDPEQMALAARFNVEQGADIIDINMGCPAKKVCKKAAGSALLADEAHVARILKAVVAAVDVPVTLKIRTGVSREARNGVTIGRIAEDAGIALLTVHGRTRADRFKGDAEYDTIARIVETLDIPVIANGDICSAPKAQAVLEHTAAAGVMIGRGANGRPWLPGQIAQTLLHNTQVATPSLADRLAIASEHLSALHGFYGDFMGVRIARKHIGWYVDALIEDACSPATGTEAGALDDEPALLCAQLKDWKSQFNALVDTSAQSDALCALAAALNESTPRPQSTGSDTAPVSASRSNQHPSNNQKRDLAA